MWLSLFCLLLLVGIAYFQIIQGVFSSLIFCVLTVLCVAFAFGTYEYVGLSFLAGWKADIALPLALVLCFAVPLTILRVVLDKAVGRACLVPTFVDKVGGVVFGVATAVLIVGVLSIAVQMVPFGGTVLGFSRIDPQTLSENSLWLSPDRVTARAASMLSAGVFSGDVPFRDDHPNLPEEIGWAQFNVPAESRHLAPPDSARLATVWVADYVYVRKPGSRADPTPIYTPVPPPARSAYWAVRVTPTAEAEDFDNHHRYTLGQLRLVGVRDGVPEQIFPIAVRDQDDGSKHVTTVESGGEEPRRAAARLWRPTDDGQIEVVFQVPTGFQPSYLTYKTGARMPLTAPSADSLHVPTAAQPEPAPSASGGDNQPRGRRRQADRTPPSGESAQPAATPPSGDAAPTGDRVSGARPTQASSFFSDKLPLVLTNYEGSEVEIAGGKLQSGSASALVAQQGKSEGAGAPIETLDVPAAQRLLHLHVDTLRAGSTLGQALSFAVRSVRNYLVIDDAGKEYTMVGQYVTANVDGDETFEVQYYPEQIGSIGRGIREFQHVHDRQLRDPSTRLVYLFLIDQGRRAVRFSTGSGSTRSVDLNGENLVAK